MLPLNAINSQHTSLLDHNNLVHIIPPLPQQRQTALVAQRTKCLRRLMSTHGVLLAITKHIPQRLNRSRLPRLTQTIRQLMLEQRRRRRESRSDRLNSRHGLRSRRVQRSEVLE